MARTKGTPNVSDARHARTVHALLGDRGVQGNDPRTAVAYAWHDGCDASATHGAYHITPTRAYARATERYTNSDARVTWPMRAYDAEGTSPVRTRSIFDVMLRGAVSPEMLASLRRERYAGGAAWRMRAMERAESYAVRWVVAGDKRGGA